MNSYILDNPPDDVFEDFDENASVIMLPLIELQAFCLPSSIPNLNAVAAALFAEALQEVDWLGSPIELDFEHGLILSDLHKVAGQPGRTLK